jgi:oxygen-dependent protoporphyrinogen oxidase
MMGGARRPNVVNRSADELTEGALNELRGLLGLRQAPVASGTWKHEHAIPQYDLDHPARLARIDRALAEMPGLHLGGAGMRAASVNRLVVDGQALADAVEATAPRSGGGGVPRGANHERR